MIPEKRMSEILLDDEREWLTHAGVDVHLDADFAKGLFDGLTALHTSLARTLQSGVDLPEVEAELKVVTDLVGWYNANQNLNTLGAEAVSLSYLKAAAVCWILDLENKKASGRRPRVRVAFDKRIFEIFAWTQSVPYKDFKLPAAIFDYVADSGSGRNERASSAAFKPVRCGSDVSPA
jgi:hypothetical protein